MMPEIFTQLSDFFEQAHFGEITSSQPLTSGHINQAVRIKTSTNDSFVVKYNDDVPANFVDWEAQGLETLRTAGIHTPQVIMVNSRFLVLEDIGDVALQEQDWQSYGRAIAQLHRHTHERFGFHNDNYLGSLPQINTWSDNGHTFFGEHRVLRYLSEPNCETALTTQDRQNLEKLVQRLPELIPEQPASLLHGDLWHTNMLVDQNHQATLIDPAVYYGWAEAELSMTQMYGMVPASFYEAYLEVNPLEDGWQERLELLTIRQLMAVIAFFGNTYDTLSQLRSIFTKFG